MKLGSETVSLVNYLSSGTEGQPEPHVGMGVTILGWTDRHAGTIYAVRGKAGSSRALEIDVGRDDARRLDKNGLSECQDYAFTRNPDARRTTYRRDSKGRWREMGIKYVGERRVYGFIDQSQRIRLGERDEYIDPTF